MSLLTVEQLKRICIGSPSAKQASNMNSFVVAVNQYGPALDLDKLYNLSSLLGQVFVESGEFNYDQEIWGPTKQQKKYDTGKLAKTLGNTPEADGDGKKHKGYGPIQLTGKYNQSRYYQWALRQSTALGLPTPPDFGKDPSKIITDPWEGLSALWYWDEGNPDGRSLNRYAEDNNQLMVTKRVNGGTTHFDRRLEYQARAALVLLGYGVSTVEIKRFQKEHPKAGDADGIIGDKTRTALHLAMKGHLPITAVKTVTRENQVPVPVKVESLDDPWYKDKEGIKEIITTIGAPVILSFFTDISIDKLALIFGFLGAGSAAWYWIRTNKAAAQNAEVERIERVSPESIIVSEKVEVE